MHHYNDVTMAATASLISSLTIVYSKIYSSADQRKHQSWPLCGEFTGDRWIPRTNGQWRGKCFHLMTSSWLMTATTRRRIPVKRRHTPPWYTACKACALPSDAALHCNGQLQQHWYGGSYKAKCFRDVRAGRIFRLHILSIHILLYVDKVQFAVVEVAS